MSALPNRLSSRASARFGRFGRRFSANSARPVSLWRPWMVALGLGLIALQVLAPAPSAQAVLISAGDGTGNTSAPAGVPGFDHVGMISTLSGVYVRNGWVLTANHVGDRPITLGGVVYEPIEGSRVQFQNPDLTFADLIAFKLTERPPLPDLLLANNASNVNTLVSLIGFGRNRGASTTYNGANGFLWDVGQPKRWGSNRISNVNQVALNTQSFWVIFDESETLPSGQNESDIVTGDSGGAALTGSGPGAELAGIMFARATFPGQPANTSIYGNAGIVADLFAYRDDILSVIDQPDCDDGLDDDGDSLVDFPDDPGCSSPTDTSEREASLVCDNGLDDDNDGTVDSADLGCASPSDSSERGSPFQCDNGLDDDLDTLIDYPDDPSCNGPTGLLEAPEPNATLLLGAGILGLSSLGSFRIRRRS